jgi:glycosyltransferase involved in cell wall biosynthesis
MIARARGCTVLMTADTVGGVWTYAMELCAALAPANVHVVLATMGRPLSADQWRSARALENVTVEQSHFLLEWMASPWLDVDRAGRWLRALARRYQPDIVHLNGYAHAALPFDAPVLVVAHSDVLTWWKAVHGESAPHSWDRYRENVRAGLHAADLVVAPTAAMLRALEDTYGGLAHTRVVANGRRVEQFAPGRKTPMILSSGRLWDEAKNIQALCRAAPGLRWPICVAGPDRAPNGGETLLAGVHTLGVLAPGELATWMERAAIYAHPARYEPFGLSVLEAALSGCALVLGDIDTLREVWGDAALYVAPDDIHALRAALDMLIDQVPLRRELAASAARRARRYTAGSMAAQYLALYESLGMRLDARREVVECAS